MKVTITVDDGISNVVLSLDEARELYEDLKLIFEDKKTNELPDMVKNPCPEENKLHPNPDNWPKQNKLWPGNYGDVWTSTTTYAGPEDKE